MDWDRKIKEVAEHPERIDPELANAADTPFPEGEAGGPWDSPPEYTPRPPRVSIVTTNDPNDVSMSDDEHPDDTNSSEGAAEETRQTGGLKRKAEDILRPRDLDFSRVDGKSKWISPT